jgi:superfamily I DNA and RNA helicase
MEIHPVILDMTANKAAEPTLREADLDTLVCSSYQSFRALLEEVAVDPITAGQAAEARSIVEGAKALTRATKRPIEDPVAQPLAVAIAKLEAEITNFDQKQRRVALVEVGGPARIRGLAGSGKTVILAMKAAYLHLNRPSEKILVTFFTKSLRATIKNLITKFYRHYSDADPDWSQIHIRHGWGGASLPGVYADACRRLDQRPLSLDEARRLPRGNVDAFGAACADLVQRVGVKAYYDHILIDEGQDFPSSFYELCFYLTKGERDRKSIVWAYDELQNILDVQIRSPEALFGLDADGKPRIDLDRSASNVPLGSSNDSVLSKCYRNQRDVLVSAHALGFGVYGQSVVQMLESADHWRDVGYEVQTGEITTGKRVRVRRLAENSPLEIDAAIPLIAGASHSNASAEVEWAVASVRVFLEGGLAPEEILVISLDDRFARKYLGAISDGLAEVGVATNNIIADPYNEPPFNLPGKVTLSTVYRAKGNEAAAVIAVGIDGVDTRTRGGRNKIFTAFTRSKAWVRVGGVSPRADAILEELKTAIKYAPDIEFTMPDLKEVELIQRDLTKKQEKAKAAREEFIRKLRAAGLSDDEIEAEIASAFKNG